MNTIRDIEGNILEIGDTVYYARKHNRHANGVLVKCIITGFNGDMVKMGKFTSTFPSSQLIKKK